MKKLSLLGILFLVLFGCRNDIDQIIDGGTMTEPPIIISEYNPPSELVEGTIFGRVYDEQENPIANAQVKYDGKNYTTDEEGRFFIIDEVLDKNGTFFTVEADGYFKGSRRLNPQEGSVNYANVQLLELSTIGTFNAAEGGQVLSDSMDQIRIDFPPNSIVFEGGDIYTTEVTVAAKYLDPTAPNIGEIMPGNLLGLNNQIEEVSLVSYGMMAVELFGDNGEKLNIAEDQTATLSFPIPAELLGSAPDEIPLWSFEDEQYGIWAEEGVATLQNGMYVGQVSHFSFWNCDAPFPIVYIEGQLITEDGVPLANASIGIFPNGGDSGRYGITDDEGFFAGKMPMDQELILKFGYRDTDCEFNPISLGSFSEDTNIGPIPVEESEAAFTITGSIVDCNNNPIENGTVILTVGDSKTEIYVGDDSTFELGILNCDNTDEISITPFDIDNLIEGETVTLPIAPEVNFGNVAACGNELPEFFTMTVNGLTATIFTDLFATIRVPETSDTLFMSFGDGSHTTMDPTPLDFDILLPKATLGTYQADVVDYLRVSIFDDAYGQNAMFSCANDCSSTNVESFEITINENEGVNGFISGEFNGVLTFRDLIDQSETDYPLSGEFRVLISL